LGTGFAISKKPETSYLGPKEGLPYWEIGFFRMDFSVQAGELEKLGKSIWERWATYYM